MKKEQNGSDYEKAFAKVGWTQFCSFSNSNRGRIAPTPGDLLRNYRHISFPTFNDGKLDDSKLEGYRAFLWQKFKINCKDLKEGKGAGVEEMPHGLKQKVTLDYILYDSTKSDKVEEETGKEYYLCQRPFGEGFEKGIEGMRCGGVRRIIVPPGLTSAEERIKVQGYAIYDVQLHNVRSSFGCWVRKRIFRED